MGKAIPAQHPAVVLRSHYKQLRALLATAMIAVLGLTVAVVILATDDDADTGVGTATQLSAPGPTGSVRYDGGPEEGTSGALSSGVASSAAPGIRYDGGPEEGMAALAQRSGPAAFNLNSTGSQPGVRYDGGPEEGASGALSSGAASSAAPGIRYDGGPEEGSAGAGH